MNYFLVFSLIQVEMFSYFTNSSTMQQLQEYKATINIRN